ncbi:hypothetical protein [Paenibacillus sp. YN15]|uniref:hypothetical protein n=1 Tax=Paenibacillus sp. YN15 TaxID=1742774 RepID=UPI000DCE6686|nr:hypothetical protein [Paenibacillus sp. YN15]RAU92729.1 hypothetical protein DQG13_27140 [Paenibacillus sp. YN15]
MQKLVCVHTVILFITVMTACNSASQLVKVEEITSIQIVRNMPGEHGVFYKDNDEIGNLKIKKFVRCINSSIPISGSTEFGKYPMIIKVEMKDGKVIIVSQAYTWTHKTLTNGNVFSSAVPKKDEVIISYGTARLRAKSPELYEWLKDAGLGK